MLYIALQKRVKYPTLLSLIEKKQISQWLYLGEDTNWRVHAEQFLSSKIPRISIADALDREALRMRRPYIDWIGACSQYNDSLEWWASEIPSKDPYNNFFLRICLLTIGRSIISKGLIKKTLIICSSSALVQELVDFSRSINQSIELIPASHRDKDGKTILEFFNKNIIDFVKSLPPVHMGRFFSRRYEQYLEENPFYRQKILNNLGILPAEFKNKKSIVIFTYADNRNFTKDDNYRDPHFGDLPQKLKERGYEIVFIPRVLQTIAFKEAAVRLMKTGENFIFPELLLKPIDLKISQSISKKYFPEIKIDSSFLDIPVYNLIKETLVETQQGFISNLLINRFISNMATLNKINPCQILYTCEGQSWESALIRSVRQYMPETKIVAYDNVTFSKLMLSMFPSMNEFAKRPLPDVIVTNGSLYRDVLLKEGFPPGKVRIGCALRHSYLWDDSQKNREAKTISGNQKKSLLIASAISHGDSIEIITKIANAFGSDENYEIFIKCHPHINVEKIKRDLGTIISHRNISFSDEPVRNLLKSADILFYTYTSVCYEALQFNVPPVCIHLENFLNLDKLDIAPDVRWVATTIDDLRNVVNEITLMNKDQKMAWERKANDVVRSALAPVESKCIDAFIL